MTLELRLNSVRAIALGWMCALALTACDNGTTTPAADTGPTTTDGGATDAGADAAAPAQSIAEIAQADGRFTLLLAAVTRAGLADALSGDGTFTVFAPTDDAFAASGITRAMIDAMPLDQLTQILQYHALTTEVRSSAITAGPATTLANLSIILGTTGGVTVNGGNAITGGANVVLADIDASNGIIHVIDRVLLPPTIPQLATYAGLTSLVTAVGSVDLATTLSGPGPFTVFAPTNAAFAELGAGAPTGDALRTVLLYHVVSGAVPSTGVPAMAPSLSPNEYGDNMTILFDTTSDVHLNGDTATVVLADVRATNGIVHVIDHVITPMNVPQAAEAAGLSSLLTAVGAAAPLTDGTTVAAALSAQAPYTVFAPTNDAFAAVASTTATLTPAQLRDVLLYHVLSPTAFTTPVLAADLPATATDLATLNGATARLDPTVTPPTIDGQPIVLTDVVVSNGVVHVIGGVMLP